MSMKSFWKILFSAFSACSALIVVTTVAAAQDAAPRARAAAPIDITGYWVAVITEDWRWRMMTPPKGSAETNGMKLIVSSEARHR